MSDIKARMESERKNYNTTLRPQTIKKLKILSAETDRRQNDLLEEAIEDLVRKLDKKLKK
jgi:predicted DNA-binding protein